MGEMRVVKMGSGGSEVGARGERCACGLEVRAGEQVIFAASDDLGRVLLHVRGGCGGSEAESYGGAQK